MAEECAQRRLAAIISADVVGYSKLIGQDEEGTIARLKSLRAEFLHPKIAEYGGRIVKTTGDGTLRHFVQLGDGFYGFSPGFGPWTKRHSWARPI